MRSPAVIDAAWLRELCLAAGTDDAAAVSLDHPDLAGERAYAQSALPGTRSLIAMAVRRDRDDCRSPARSVANQEFTGDGPETAPEKAAAPAQVRPPVTSPGVGHHRGNRSVFFYFSVG
ncbi:hypothetical protein [Streptomyces torulosus]|uniref:hypothetical protein n=1 Tax=Streptomyces torulosus TaxID=68276 RepID=UPI0006EB98F3|nr:hypothetical protein [Streptomyces torulosus]